MKILIINPVGRSTWNDVDRKLYRRYFSQGVELDVVSLPRGPQSIETRESFNEVIPAVIEIGRSLTKDYDGVVVNCFLDPGVKELREEIDRVVIGAGEASLSMARLYGKPILIVTVGLGDPELVWEKAYELGLKGYIDDVVGIPIGVLDIDKDRSKTLELLASTLKRYTNRKYVVVLGCTGLGGFGEELQKIVGVPVVDPVKASAIMVEGLVKLIKVPQT